MGEEQGLIKPFYHGKCAVRQFSMRQLAVTQRH